jgi:membrane fusion protein, copper/silver efflux system
MKATTLTLIALPLAAALAGGAYWLGRQQAMDASVSAAAPAKAATAPGGAPQRAGDVDPVTGKKVLYWHDPMVPGQRFDRPGKSPFMDMQLEPVYADSGADEGTVAISARVRQNMGVRTAEATTGGLTIPLTAVGSVAYNERDQALVQARANGFIEKLYVRAPLDPVRKGQALLELYVPDWVAAQEEYFAVRRMQGAGTDVLIDAAKQRMRLAGMSDDQIARVTESGVPQARITLTAPIGGVVSELGAREGMSVVMGTPLFRVNGLGSVWVNAEVPESAAAQVRAGTPVDVRTPAAPGAVLKGRVSAVLPEVNPATRTIKVRIDVANPKGTLVPGLFASVDFAPATTGDETLVPSEAVIPTGKRTVVFVAEGEGRFRAVDVETGTEANGMTAIRKGINPGDKVVVSGQFLIDSDASLKGVTNRLSEPAQPGGTPPDAGEHQATGRVEAIAKDEIMLSHDPVPALKWPAMTMGFKPPAAWPAEVKVGDRVAFTFKTGATQGEFVITSVTKSGAAPAAAAPEHQHGAPAAGAKP